MSPKSKTQKRNERARNAQKIQAGKGGSNREQNQSKQKAERKDIVDMKAAMKEMKAKVTAFDTLHAKMMADPELRQKIIMGKPAAASDPPMIDEKYVKVPTVSETALALVASTLETAKVVANEANIDGKGKCRTTVQVDLPALRAAVNQIKLESEQKKVTKHVLLSAAIGKVLKTHLGPATDQDFGLGWTREVVRAGLRDKPIKSNYQHQSRLQQR